MAAVAEQVERTRRKTWSRARSEVFVPYRLLFAAIVAPSAAGPSRERETIDLHAVHWKTKAEECAKQPTGREC